jgi:hypothetical protein
MEEGRVPATRVSGRVGGSLLIPGLTSKRGWSGTATGGPGEVTWQSAGRAQNIANLEGRDGSLAALDLLLHGKPNFGPA